MTTLHTAANTIPNRHSKTDEVARGLQVEGLRVEFGGLVAVDGVSLVAPEGRITGLIGPNGAGKTTTFNACSGMLRPTAGSVRLFDADVTALGVAPRARLGLGRTFQRMELFDSMTVLENVALGLEAGRVGASIGRHLFASRAARAELAEASREAIELCGIADIAERATGALSTGQRRLVELARVLAGRFHILLLDEPSSGLDADETRAFGDIIEAVVAERGVGILVVEHDMSLVMRVCSHLFVLDFGVPIFDGTPAEVRASEVVRAAYLGSEAG
ncbi:MAG: ABC transporter ATP-binding protein [Actinomycetota bacterium]|nr:ABC transporter ATP-binding protein [Actinomycetota bacterium]